MAENRLLTPEQELYSTDTFEILKSLLKFLDPIQKRIFELMLEGCEPPEIAERLQISRSAGNLNFREAIAQLHRLAKGRSGC